VFFDKAGLGYKPDKQQKIYKNFFASTQTYSSPFLTCFYCGKKGHGTSTCYFKKNSNSIKMIWVPKDLLLKLTHKDPRKFGYLSHKHVHICFLEEELVHK